MSVNDSGEKLLVAMSVNLTSAEPALRAAGYRVVARVLQSSPENWQKIAKLLQTLNPDEELVVAKFTEFTLFLAALPRYAASLEALVGALQKLRHVVYIYDANLSGTFSCVKGQPDAY